MMSDNMLGGMTDYVLRWRVGWSFECFLGHVWHSIRNTTVSN